jgi:HlyD family secretion protein
VKRKWRVWIIIGGVLVLGVGVVVGASYSKRGIVEVQTGRATRQDLTSIVTASGEIKPKNYINIGANAQGVITQILVKEGDTVRRGQLLATLESVQPRADVTAQEATLDSAQADTAAAEASVAAADENLDSTQATIDRAKADLEQAKLDLGRGQQLLDQKLIAKQEFDSRRTTYESRVAAVREAEARYAQAKAQRAQAESQLAGTRKRIAQNRAMLVRLDDVLKKHSTYAPLDGVVTNLPVRIGETVVPGIQNSSASTIMTIADMSLITAEVKVDETDIVNVALGQTGDITIDAIPNKIFKGHVTEIGNTAILRSTGVAASQSAVSSQEAKDFKVVLALDDPPADIRPGLSATAKITTATRKNALTIPIQALTVRRKMDLEPEKKGGVEAASRPDPPAEKARQEEIQGVFVAVNGKAVFRKVDTGITGATDIEVTGGLRDGDEVLTGSYKAIRTIRNEAKIKVNNEVKVEAKAD